MDPLRSATGVGPCHAVESPSTAGEDGPQGPILPEPVVGGVTVGDDMIATIVAMMARSFREDRTAARNEAAVEEKAIATATNRRIAEMRAQASEIRKEGLVSGLTTAAGGVLQGVGAGVTLAGGAKPWVEVGSGASDGTKGTGALFASTHRAAEKEDEADAAVEEGAAQRADRRSQQARADVDEARRLLQKVAEFLQSVRDSQNAAMQAAVRRA